MSFGSTVYSPPPPPAPVAPPPPPDVLGIQKRILQQDAMQQRQPMGIAANMLSGPNGDPTIPKTAAQTLSSR